MKMLKYDIITVFLIGNELRRNMNLSYHLDLHANVLPAISMVAHNMRRVSNFDIPIHSQINE